jgi:hypothetical protein
VFPNSVRLGKTKAQMMYALHNPLFYKLIFTMQTKRLNRQPNSAFSSSPVNNPSALFC